MSLILKYDLGNPHRLPVGYTPLAYIESSGTLYIDSMLKVDSNTKIVDIISPTNDSGYFGNYYSGNFFSYCVALNGLCVYYGQSSSVWKYISCPRNNKYLVIIDGVNKLAKINGAETLTLPNNVFTKGSNTYKLFDLERNNGSYSDGMSTKLYSSKMWDNGLLVRDFIPAKNSSGVVGLFDCVSQTFKTNAGTGTFIAGPEVVVLPYEYLLVEYLKGNGLEWIDTGVSCGTTDIVNTTWTLDATEANGEWQGINGQMQLSIANNSASDGANTISISKLTNVEYNYNNGSSTLKVGSTSYTRSWGLRPALNIYLWKLSNYSGALNDCKISKFYANKAGTVVRNMVACYRRSDLKPGMYDTVNNVFYTNSGSGEFVLGPVIEESSRQLEYNNAGSNYIGKPTNVHHSTNNPSTTQINEGSGDFSGGSKLQTTIPALGNSFSISWWANGTYGGTMMWGIYPFNPLYNLCLNVGDGNENPWYRPGTTTQITAPSNNVWHHFVVTGDGSSNKLYVDGVHYGTSKTYRGCSGTSLILNGWNMASSYNWNGKMYDFRIYNNVLTADEVLQIYKRGL